MSDSISGSIETSVTTNSSVAELSYPIFALANPEPTVNVIILYNPLDLSERTVDKIDWGHRKPLSAYLDGLPDHIEWAITVNDRVTGRELWDTTYLDIDDFIVIMPIPEGGGGGGGSGKMIIRMVAMLAVAIVAPELAGALGPLMGLGAFGTSVLAVGMTVAGAMLVNAMLPAPKPPTTASPAATTSQQNDGLSYGIDGPKNTSGENFVVPVAYGTFRTGGNIIDQRVDNTGDTQLLYMRMLLSEGPIDSIDTVNVEVDEQPHANYNSVQIDYRLGVDNQDVSPWFNRTARQINKGSKLIQADTVYTTTSEVEGFRLDFTCPNGLAVYDTQGNRGTNSVSINISYSVHGQNNWINPLGKPFTITASQRSAVRRSFDSGGLGLAIYDIKVSRTNAESTVDTVLDQVFLADVTEILQEQVQLNFSAWLAIQVQLGDQLNQQPKITIPFKGRQVYQYDAYGNVTTFAWSDNPAWITLDILMNTRFGGGLSASRFDMSKWKQWADFCTSKGLKFNGIFDTDSNVWDATQFVLRCGHAQIVMVGTRYSVAMEAPDIPVMMFGMGNILDGTFSIDWLPLQDRANEVEISYFDELDHYKQHAVRAVDYDAIAAGVPQRLSTISMMGVTNATVAFNEAWLQIALNKFVLQTCTFDAPLEAIGCLVGDVVYVQHDMPQWGFGGRIAPGSTDTVINLDRPVTMGGTGDYRLLLIHATVQRSGNTPVTLVVGNSIFTTSPISPTGYTRLIWRNGSQVFDTAVLSVVLGSPLNEIILDQSPASWGLAPGANVELWDTDVVEERSVVLNSGNQKTVTVTAPFTITPDAYANFMFGENTKMKKPFRVKSIKGSHEYKRTLTLIEYNESVYGDPTTAAPTPNYSALGTVIAQVTNVDGFEEIFYSGNAVRVRFTLTWNPPNSMYEGADIYLQTNGATWNHIGSVRGGASSFPLEVDTGDRLEFKVVPFDGAGDRASFSTAGIFEHIVLGKNAPPGNVFNFAVSKEAGGLLYTWNANTDVDLAGYEIRQGPTWDAANLLVTGYTGNRFFSNKTSAGTFTWLIRAITSNGVYSATPTTVTLTLAAPAQVQGFATVSNGDNIIFSWIPNADPDVVLYELREGGNWASSSFIAQVGGNHHVVQNDIPGNRIFWIKAIDNAGIYSDIAVFSTPTIAANPNRNVVFTQDEGAASFPHFRYNTTIVGSTLVLTTGLPYGEYVTTVDMGAELQGRTTIADTFDAVILNNTRWVDATFDWRSTQADNPWISGGSIDNVFVGKQWALYTGLTSNDVDGITFDGSTTSLGGVTPTVSGTPSYAPGRFSNGLSISDNIGFTYSLSLPASFSLSLSLVPGNMNDLSRLLKLVDGGTGSLTLDYNPSTDCYELVGSDHSIVSAPNLFQTGDRLIIAITQTATTRRLYVGRMDDLLTTSGVLAAAPLSSGFTAIIF